MKKFKLVFAHIINPISDKKSQLIVDGCMVLYRDHKNNYRILEIGEKSIENKYSNKRSVEILDYSGHVIIPSFFDMHFHWVQDDVRERPKDSLLTWLSKYTWPNEAKFKDKPFAKNKARIFSQELINNGTLGGACFASIHKHSVEFAHLYFTGDFTIGNVLMDINSPNYLTMGIKKSLTIIASLANKYKKLYALTPRFAITTSPELMKLGAKIAKKNNSFIQTHLSETEQEIDTVLSIYRKLNGFENVRSYTEIYQRCNILGAKTFFAHGIHLDSNELKLLKKSKSKVIHCPTSNAPIKDKGLGSGLFDYVKTEKFGIDWSLGSDIGGGPYLSMFDVMYSFVNQNKNNPPTYEKALYRATLKSAELLGIEKSTGNFTPHKYANFLVLPLIRNKKNRSTNDILSALIKSCVNNRKTFTNLVESVFYKGTRLK